MEVKNRTKFMGIITQLITGTLFYLWGCPWMGVPHQLDSTGLVSGKYCRESLVFLPSTIGGFRLQCSLQSNDLWDGSSVVRYLPKIVLTLGFWKAPGRCGEWQWTNRMVPSSVVGLVFTPWTSFFLYLPQTIVEFSHLSGKWTLSWGPHPVFMIWKFVWLNYFLGFAGSIIMDYSWDSECELWVEV